MLISKDIETIFIDKRDIKTLYDELHGLRRGLERENMSFYREYPQISELMHVLKRGLEDE